MYLQYDTRSERYVPAGCAPTHMVVPADWTDWLPYNSAALPRCEDASFADHLPEHTKVITVYSEHVSENVAHIVLDFSIIVALNCDSIITKTVCN